MRGLRIIAALGLSAAVVVGPGCHDSQNKQEQASDDFNDLVVLQVHTADGTTNVFRDDDIVIGTYAKSGTTWTQQIVSQLIFNGEEGLNVGEMSPWIDMRVPPIDVKLAAVEAQRHRRFVKTHLPVDALVFSPKAKCP